MATYSDSSMTRRRRIREEQQVDRWVVSYADFITLLLAFFVVMYSISSVNEGKYKVLSDSLEGIFKGADYRLDPLVLGDIKGEDNDRDFGLIDHLPSQERTKTEPSLNDEEAVELHQIQQDATREFQKLIADGELKVASNELWVEIEIQSSLLFASGSAQPGQDADPILESVAQLLKDYNNPIHVEGFTDDKPVESERFASNWELSAARAAAVVRVLGYFGVAPERMAAVGYGQYQPKVSNLTARGRSINRRVKIIVSRDERVRRAMSGFGSGYIGEETVDTILEQKVETEAPVAPLQERETEDGVIFTRDPEL